VAILFSDEVSASVNADAHGSIANHLVANLFDTVRDSRRRQLKKIHMV
jgi:hypothetical protein